MSFFICHYLARIYSVDIFFFGCSIEKKKKTRTGKLDYHSVGYALASHPKTHSQKKNAPKADGQMGGGVKEPSTNRGQNKSSFCNIVAQEVKSI